MNTTITNNWYEINQRSLEAALALVRTALEQHAKTVENVPVSTEHPSNILPEREQLISTVDTTTGTEEGAINRGDTINRPPTAAHSALEVLCEAFSLSPFERDILLLCAGIELDATFASLCAAAQSNPQRAYPTFGLALAALPNPHWSAVLPNAPLRHWRLLEVETGSDRLTLSRLRIDERVLHYLNGVNYLDERLAALVERVRVAGKLVPSHQALTEQIVTAWIQARDIAALPVVQLCGAELMDKRAIASAVCNTLDLSLCIISAYAIPLPPGEFAAFTRLWEREVILSGQALLLDCDELDTTDAVREHYITQLIESTTGAIIVSSRERRRVLQRPMLTFDVCKPTPGEQRSIWQSTLGGAASSLNGKIEVLTSQFNLSASSISSIATQVLGHLATMDHQQQQSGAGMQSYMVGAGLDESIHAFSPALVAQLLWDTCRVQARSRLDDLAQRIEPAAAWDDLVVPELQRQVLRDIAVHVKHRTTVYETWGFATKGSRGLGISALFVGGSGTGKTMAAEVLANELRLDLYRIDLSQVVSKYIGETEKNLRRVFDAAEESGAILLFDEADALFGKRSEIRDSHDRYANIEVSYLLQRMEAYRGLAILTTNFKSALDTAFLRRIRFTVQFPFPDAAQRAEIWRRIFPATTPTKDLDCTKLARLNVTGGNIRNIALNAAFLAADAGEPVQMKHILRATRSEYLKLEKSLTETEIGGWV